MKFVFDILPPLLHGQNRDFLAGRGAKISENSARILFNTSSAAYILSPWALGNIWYWWKATYQSGGKQHISLKMNLLYLPMIPGRYDLA